jgi:hypothetical protein
MPFCVETPFSSDRDRCFGGTYCLSLQGRRNRRATNQKLWVKRYSTENNNLHSSPPSEPQTQTVQILVYHYYIKNNFSIVISSRARSLNIFLRHSFWLRSSVCLLPS